MPIRQRCLFGTGGRIGGRVAVEGSGTGEGVCGIKPTNGVHDPNNVIYNSMTWMEEAYIKVTSMEVQKYG